MDIIIPVLTGPPLHKISSHTPRVTMSTKASGGSIYQWVLTWCNRAAYTHYLESSLLILETSIPRKQVIVRKHFKL